MELADKRTMGRLSRANVGGMTFDVETEAQLHDPPQVRTYVFVDGRIVDRVVWEFQAHDSSASARLVSLQHDSVVKQINTRMANGRSEDDPRVIGTLPPPSSIPTASASDKKLIESIRPVAAPEEDVLGFDAARPANGIFHAPRPTRSIGLLVPAMSAGSSTLAPETYVPGSAPVSSIASEITASGSGDARMPFADGAVIDDDAIALIEMGPHAAEFANLAFLATGLDALLARHLTLGHCEHVAIERRDGTVLVAREGGLSAAFLATRRGSHARAVSEVRRALARVEEET